MQFLFLGGVYSKKGFKRDECIEKGCVVVGEDNDFNITTKVIYKSLIQSFQESPTYT